MTQAVLRSGQRYKCSTLGWFMPYFTKISIACFTGKAERRLSILTCMQELFENPRVIKVVLCQNDDGRQFDGCRAVMVT